MFYFEIISVMPVHHTSGPGFTRTSLFGHQDTDCPFKAVKYKYSQDLSQCLESTIMESLPLTVSLEQAFQGSAY